MTNWLKSSARFFIVAIGIILLTSFTIDATDTLKGSQTALSILSSKLTESKCPSNTVMIESDKGKVCVDIYEASAGSNCAFSSPKSVLDTTLNIANAKCLPVSEAGKTPWTFVAKSQAEQICAKEGKRLLSAEEWFIASLGTPDSVQNCNLSGSINDSGNYPDCKSGSGIYDMVGNVWEYIDVDINDGLFMNRALPEDGYVVQIDDSGIAVETGVEPNVVYNSDYFWSKGGVQFNLMRGGYYGSQSDGGIYSTYAQADTNFASAAIGFRCAMTLQ